MSRKMLSMWKLGHKSNQCPFRNNGNIQNRQNTQNTSVTTNPLNANCNTNSSSNPTVNNTNNYIPYRRPRFQGKCNHYGKWGHRREDSWCLKNQFRIAERANVCMPVSENVPKNRVEEEVVLINKMPTIRNGESGLNEIRNNIGIADSGASSHTTNDTHGLINTRNIQLTVKIGSGDYVEAELIGDLRGVTKQK